MQLLIPRKVKRLQPIKGRKQQTVLRRERRLEKYYPLASFFKLCNVGMGDTLAWTKTEEKGGVIIGKGRMVRVPSIQPVPTSGVSLIKDGGV